VENFECCAISATFVTAILAAASRALLRCVGVVYGVHDRLRHLLVLTTPPLGPLVLLGVPSCPLAGAKQRRLMRE
jgi:hypothetical protein